MHERNKPIRRPLLLCLLLLAGCQVRTSTPEAQEDASGAAAPATGMDIRAISLGGAGDADFSLLSFRGRVLVLDFWATWSAPSQAERTLLNGLSKEWSAQNVAFVGMVVDKGERSQIAEAVRAFDVAYPLAWGDENVQSAFGGIRAVPTKVLVDKKGQIRKQLPGVVTEAMLRAEVNTLIAEN